MPRARRGSLDTRTPTSRPRHSHPLSYAHPPRHSLARLGRRLLDLICLLPQDLDALAHSRVSPLSPIFHDLVQVTIRRLELEPPHRHQQHHSCFNQRKGAAYTRSGPVLKGPKGSFANTLHVRSCGRGVVFGRGQEEPLGNEGVGQDEVGGVAVMDEAVDPYGGVAEGWEVLARLGIVKRETGE